jgi:DNA-binding transcriptional regulator YiaG
VKTPTTKQILNARTKAGLTQTAAGALVYTSCRAWQYWEAGKRKMAPAVYELFLLKCKISLDE